MPPAAPPSAVPEKRRCSKSISPSESIPPLPAVAIDNE